MTFGTFGFDDAWLALSNFSSTGLKVSCVGAFGLFPLEIDISIAISQYVRQPYTDRQCMRLRPRRDKLGLIMRYIIE